MTGRTFVAADSTKIFYEVEGDGPIDLLLCDGIGCDGFIWKYLRPELARRGRVIHPHMRGHGRSDEPVDPQRVTIGHIVEDLRGILDAEGSRRVVALGHSMGVQVALELCRRDGPRVAGLVLMCGSYENPVATFRNGHALRRLLPAIRLLATGVAEPLRAVWKALVPTSLSFHLAQIVEIHPDWVRPKDFAPYLDHLARMHPRVFFEMLAGAEAHSAAAYLPHIDVPVLVVSGEEDRFTPAWLSHQMAERIPTSEHLDVREGTHTAPIEHPTLVNLTIERFLDRL